MRRLAGVAIAAWMIGCGPASGDDGSGPGGNPDGGGTANDDAAVANCGAQEEEIRVITNGPPPDMLIVLDRSGSMADPPIPFPGFPRPWTTMKNALKVVTEFYDENIKFGLTLFPTDAMCGYSAGTVVGLDLGHAGQISGALNANPPDGSTPASVALEDALAIYNSIPVNPDGRYVLFATDGEPNCVEGDPLEQTQDAIEALATAGIKTIVLGYSANPFGDVFGSSLNDFAQAGGAPQAGGPPYYYPASNEEDLKEALLAIAGGVIKPSCSFHLTSQPPDPTNVRVSINGTAIPRDPGHNNGWDYTPNASTITFFGDFCDDIESGDATNVQFTYGCPGPVVE